MKQDSIKLACALFIACLVFNSCGSHRNFFHSGAPPMGQAISKSQQKPS